MKVGLGIFLTAAVLSTAPAAAAEWTLPEIRRGLEGSFALPFGQPRLHPLEGLTLQVGATLPLSRDAETGPASGGVQGPRPTGSPTLDATVRYEPLPGWFAVTTFHKYLKENRQAPWDPDFSYGFGYDSQKPFSLRLVYFNYADNRLSPSRRAGENATRFNQGTWSVGWKFPLPEALATPMLIDPDLSIDCATDVNISPRYWDDRTQRNQSVKTALSLGCHYPVVAGLYLEWKAFWYPRSADQQPWDPDFNYAVGWSMGYPGTLSVRYGNYSGNRWPGRSNGRSQGRFVDGSISVAWSYAW